MSWFIEFCGLIATGCFMVSAIPQAIKSIKDKNSDGIAWMTTILWFIAEICMSIYVVGLYGFKDKYLLLNYAINLPVCAIILFFKIFPKRIQN